MKLIGYLSLGYPNIERTHEIAKVYTENGVNVLEVDLPAKDPYLDSPFIQDRMLGALKKNSNYQDYLDAIVKISQDHPKQEIFVLAYEATIKEVGVERFIKHLQKAHVKNMIYVGGNDQEVKQQLMNAGIGLASYVRLDLPESDLVESKSSNGFIYLQAKSDKTDRTLKDAISYLRKHEAVGKKINCGVGVSTKEDVRMVKEAGADGVFIGSTFLKLHDDVEALKKKIEEIKSATL